MWCPKKITFNRQPWGYHSFGRLPTDFTTQKLFCGTCILCKLIYFFYKFKNNFSRIFSLQKFVFPSLGMSIIYQMDYDLIWNGFYFGDLGVLGKALMHLKMNLRILQSCQWLASFLNLFFWIFFISQKTTIYRFLIFVV